MSTSCSSPWQTLFSPEDLEFTTRQLLLDLPHSLVDLLSDSCTRLHVFGIREVEHGVLGSLGSRLEICH
jgi:hypothetical protein